MMAEAADISIWRSAAVYCLRVRPLCRPFSLCTLATLAGTEMTHALIARLAARNQSHPKKGWLQMTLWQAWSVLRPLNLEVILEAGSLSFWRAPASGSDLRNIFSEIAPCAPLRCAPALPSVCLSASAAEPLAPVLLPFHAPPFYSYSIQHLSSTWAIVNC